MLFKLTHQSGWGTAVGAENVILSQQGKALSFPAHSLAFFCWYLHSEPFLWPLSGCDLVNNWHRIRSLSSKSSEQPFTQVINLQSVVGAQPYSSSQFWEIRFAFVNHTKFRRPKEIKIVASSSNLMTDHFLRVIWHPFLKRTSWIIFIPYFTIGWKYSQEAEQELTYIQISTNLYFKSHSQCS